MGCVSEWGFMESAKHSSMVWVGRGDINSDSYKCEQEASSNSSGATGYVYMPIGQNAVVLPMNSDGGRQINQQLYHSCMRAHGYALYDGYELSRLREKEANKSVSAPLGSLCGPSNVTVGTRLRRPQDGKMVKVIALYANSPRCSDPATPTPVDVEDANEEESSVSAPLSPQDSNTQFNLGARYHFGQGVSRDYAKAREWYEQAAAQGSAMAQLNLGVMYQNGQGVPQDYATARGWYEKAAAQGLSQAQLNLGVLFYNGLGMSQNSVMASQWWEKAAYQGHAQAQYKLGLLYSNLSPPSGFGRIFGGGQGVRQDYVRAYMWFSLAAGHLTGDERSLAGEYRDQVASLMTPAQIAEAQRLTNQCQAQQFKGC